jgi:large subunit ribosomal protein L4
MELEVLNIQGKSTGRKVSLDDSIFNVDRKDHIVYLEIKRFLAAQRQGTHKSKEKAEITGSTRKLRKQKGSGAARVGSVKSPVLRGGATVFGPRPRDYSFKLSKTQKRLAKKVILSQKLRDNQIIILENFSFDSPKTKDFLKIQDSLNLLNKKSLFVLGEQNKNVYLSSRNLGNTKTITYTELDSYNLMLAKNIVFLEEAVQKVQDNLSK